MAVFRVERSQNYTVMSNYHLRDKTITSEKQSRKKMQKVVK